MDRTFFFDTTHHGMEHRIGWCVDFPHQGRRTPPGTHTHIYTHTHQSGLLLQGSSCPQKEQEVLFLGYLILALFHLTVHLIFFQPPVPPHQSSPSLSFSLNLSFSLFPLPAPTWPHFFANDTRKKR
ncbi:hypothetical protein B0O80DRAFT_441430 [Mortierella sp. GBAus27b]|nr:hypothetical protein B0O80DRAFT_441430 [Mortierella sp. GBAus27b]